MLLLHGFLESSQMWEPLIPQLLEHHQVITIDLPGMGKSEVISDVHSPDLMAEVVKEILDYQKIDSAIFVGHSMGGYVTMAMAELFPEKIETLVLLNSSPVADTHERRRNRDRAIKMMDKHPQAFVRMAIANWSGESGREIHKEKLEAAKKIASTFPVEGIKAALRGMKERPDRTEVLKRFPREKYVFLSEDDPIIPVKKTTRLAENCYARPVIVEGGHLSVIENLQAVEQFLYSFQ